MEQVERIPTLQIGSEIGNLGFNMNQNYEENRFIYDCINQYKESCKKSTDSKYKIEINLTAKELENQLSAPINQQKDRINKNDDSLGEYLRIKNNNSNIFYYNNLQEFHGVINSIDFQQNTFIATLTDVNDKNKVFNAEFDIDDSNFESDKERIKVGASIVWLIGKEQEIMCWENGFMLGQQSSISKFIVRRVKSLNNKERETVERNATKWAEFFSMQES